MTASELVITSTLAVDADFSGALQPLALMNTREIRLVKAGFTPEQAIHISTANGAEFLGQGSRIGTIAVGKQADLVVLRGDPSRQISDIRSVELVFRKGIGYSSAKLFGAVRGLVGVE
jgi:imidazolonepropionase-like amidohydrolase